MTRSPFSQSCCTTPSAMLYWGAAFVLLYVMGLLLRSVWPAISPYGDTLILVALGGACFLNFGRHRTLHCGITGPVFLLAAIVAALVEAERWSLDLSVVWGVVLIAVGVAFVIEWRTVGKDRKSNA
jgi:hypothetical protein